MTPANVAASPAHRSIVLADDDTMIREAVAELLIAEGYAVHTARDGMEALTLIRAAKPDYIILDVMLPKLDGDRVCAAVRQDVHLQQIPIIVFSSLSPQDYQFFPRLRADVYVAKGPLAIAAQNLLTAIRDLEKSIPGQEKGKLLGYENYRARRLVTEMMRERRHMEAVLRVLAPGALELDRDGRVVWANPGACAVLMKTEAEVVGEPFASFVPAPDRRRVQVLLDDLVHSEEASQLVTAFRLGGSEVAVRLAPIAEDNTCSGILVLLEHA